MEPAHSVGSVHRKSRAIVAAAAFLFRIGAAELARYSRCMAKRTVWVAPERLAGWVDRFTDRHPGTEVDVAPRRVTLSASDGATAEIAVGWGGLPATSPLTVEDVVAHLVSDRRVGVLLARRAAHAVGIFAGTRLLASKVDTHYVQGRTKAGGWSQQRYARRRSNQADYAAAQAADDLRRVVWDARREWDWFVTGGDASAVTAVLRLVPELAPHAPDRVLPTADPRLAVLRLFPNAFRSVPVALNEAA